MRDYPDRPRSARRVRELMLAATGDRELSEKTEANYILAQLRAGVKNVRID